jgi:hypothetical protein
MSVPLPLAGVARDRFFFQRPELWPEWPFLPVVRRRPGGEPDLGLLYDFAHTSGRTGFSCTVFVCNYFERPRTEEGLLALPRETFDTWEEVSRAGWSVD